MTSFARCFDRGKIDQIRPLIPKAYQAMENMVGYKPMWPDRIECMTSAEIRDGKKHGAGHGLYLVDEQRIRINASMPADEILYNFIHENLHHALPNESEASIDRRTPIVFEQVMGSPSPYRYNPVAPVTLVVRYNTFERWRRPIEKPSALVWRQFSGLGVLEQERLITAPAGRKRGKEPRPGRQEPESLRQAVDWAAGKLPVSVRTEGHMEALTYEFKTIGAADKARKRLEKLRKQGYTVQSTVLAKRSAVERGKQRRVVVG